MASELEGLRKQLDIQIQRLNALREQFAIQSDPNLKFTLQIQITELEASNYELKNRIETGYGIAAIDSKSLLEQKIRELTIDVETSLGEFYLVNCNRKPTRDNFWDAFDDNAERQNPFQFYFVVACPTQQPNSFAERMIYEIIIEELEEQFDAINYVHQPNSRRVKIEDLPLGRNLRNSQKEFKKYFARRFGISDAETAFEDYIKTGLPRLDYQYIATVFDVNANEWDDRLMKEYLDWIIDVFTHTHENVPTFVFFFAIFLKDAHIEPITPSSQKIIDSVQETVVQNDARCTFLSQLTPVSTDLVADWIRDLGEQNQSKIDDLVTILVNSLPKEKKTKYDKNKTLDMSDIERFQEVVYKVITG